MSSIEAQQDVRRAGVIGLGLLGRGITASLLAGGLEVVAFDREPAVRSQIETFLSSAMSEIGAHRPECSLFCHNWRDRFTLANALESFADCDLVIESVSELLDVKRELLITLETIVGPDVPLASNTSSLPITELQSGMDHPQRVLGMHWAEPAFATRFLELIGGKQTSSTVLERMASFGRRLGKEPCIVTDLSGFIVNRLGYAMYREAMNLLQSGIADAATIDRAYRNAAGLWASFCGPFRWIDITGGPALYARAMQRVMPDLACGDEVPQALQTQVGRDRLALESGGPSAPTGFYQESSEEKQRWLELLHRQAWEIEALKSRMDKAMEELGLRKKES